MGINNGSKQVLSTPYLMDGVIAPNESNNNDSSTSATEMSGGVTINNCSNFKTTNTENANNETAASRQPHRPIARDFSAKTAASFTEAQSPRQHPTGNDSESSVEQINKLNREIQQLLIHASSGLIFLIVFIIFDLIDKAYGSAVVLMLLAVPVGVTGIIGCRRRSWRLLLGFFVTAFLLVVLMSSTAIYFIVSLIAGKLPEGERTSGWVIASIVLRCLVFILFAVFWVVAAYYAEKVVRLLLTKELIETRQNNNNNNSCLHPPPAFVVGHPVDNETATVGHYGTAVSVQNVDDTKKIDVVETTTNLVYDRV